ncbi:MAG: Gfo/Idh/MocA family oxidoreductase, partial [Algisphaera sp.]
AVMGVNGDLGIHKADLMRYLLGEEFTHVGGFVTQRDKKQPNGKPIALDDNAWLTLKTESGVVGSINISWTHYGQYEANGTTLFCEKGVMRIGEDPEYGVIVEFRNGQKECYNVGAMANNANQAASGVIDSFTDGILNRRKPTIDGQEGYKALNVILTAVEAAASSTIKKIPR